MSYDSDSDVEIEDIAPLYWRNERPPLRHHEPVRCEACQDLERRIELILVRIARLEYHIIGVSSSGDEK